MNKKNFLILRINTGTGDQREMVSQMDFQLQNHLGDSGEKGKSRVRG